MVLLRHISSLISSLCLYYITTINSTLNVNTSIISTTSSREICQGSYVQFDITRGLTAALSLGPTMPIAQRPTMTYQVLDLIYNQTLYKLLNNNDESENQTLHDCTLQ